MLIRGLPLFSRPFPLSILADPFGSGFSLTLTLLLFFSFLRCSIDITLDRLSSLILKVLDRTSFLSNELFLVIDYVPLVFVSFDFVFALILMILCVH